MKQNRPATFAAILASEDGTLNVAKSEPGGASKWGVSVDFLTDWYRLKNMGRKATVDDVAKLTDQDAMTIYGVMILDAIHFDDLPSGVDYRLADIVTNLGVTGGITLLQIVLGMWQPTGHVDEETMSRIHGIDPLEMVAALSAAWITKKHDSPSWYPVSVNPNSKVAHGAGHGWTNRNISATALALSMADRHE
jgi:lysozyme family protein